MNLKKSIGNLVFRWLPFFIVLGLIIFIMLKFISTAAVRPLTELENLIFELLILCIGAILSYLFTREVKRTATKAHSKSAFRRLIFMYNGLSGLISTIRERRKPDESGNIPSYTLDTLEVMATFLILTANDALEDWRDIVPEDVEEVQRKVEMETSRNTENS